MLGQNEAMRRKCAWLIAFVLLVLDSILGKHHSFLIIPWIQPYLRWAIQCGLLTAWMISIGKRIVHKRVKWHLQTSAVLLALLLTVRTIKYELPDGLVTEARYLWYLYYVALLFVPVLVLFTGLHLGKPESFNPNHKWRILYIVAIAGIVAVLTNDLHGMVFSFVDGIPSMGDTGTYTYGPIYFVLVLIIGAEVWTFVFLLIRHCRLSSKKSLVIAPAIPLIALIAYLIMYALQVEFIARVIPDMSEVIAVCFVCIIELCIKVGLLPSNTHYLELYGATSVDVRFTEVEQPQSMMDGNIRISSRPIDGGFVVWKDDLTEINHITSELEELNTELEDSYGVLMEEYKTRHTREALAWKNRLYNSMQNETAAKLEELECLTRELTDSTCEHEIRMLTAKIAVICAYLKRRNNLLFIAEENEMIKLDELAWCIKESIDNIRLCAAEADMRMDIHGELDFSNTKQIYDLFELVVEASIDTLKEIYVVLTENDNKVIARIILKCSNNMEKLDAYGFEVTYEGDGEWVLEYQVHKGGDCDE